MSDDLDCRSCRWEDLTHRQSPCSRCLHGSNGHTINQFEPKLEPAKPARVDIDATGRKALDLGPSWSWVAAEWKQEGAVLWVSMARKIGSNWGDFRLDCRVEKADFVWEVENG